MKVVVRDVGGFALCELVRLTMGDVEGLDAGEIVGIDCRGRWWIYS
jgi:5-methylthioribose kinase